MYILEDGIEVRRRTTRPLSLSVRRPSFFGSSNSKTVCRWVCSVKHTVRNAMMRATIRKVKREPTISTGPILQHCALGIELLACHHGSWPKFMCPRYRKQWLRRTIEHQTARPIVFLDSHASPANLPASFHCPQCE